MRIGMNVLSMNARQSLYENEKRMNVAMEHLVAFNTASQANGFLVTTIVNITFKTIERTP